MLSDLPRPIQQSWSWVFTHSPESSHGPSHGAVPPLAHLVFWLLQTRPLQFYFLKEFFWELASLDYSSGGTAFLHPESRGDLIEQLTPKNAALLTLPTLNEGPGPGSLCLVYSPKRPQPPHPVFLL